MNLDKYQKAADLLKKIPSISKKQINKILMHTIDSSKEDITALFEALLELKENVKKCQICNYLNDKDVCDICASKIRERKLLIVETSNDVEKFENLDAYNGYYFVLEGIHTIKGINLKVEANIEKILNNLDKYKEITLALSSTLEGQTTSQYIYRKLRDLKFDNVYQLSMGIPYGIAVEYVDPITLKQSLINKNKF
ncbi:recombination protein RecR [[Mycoplasma] falconis]|uniref:Recombination protein RecR n=1 Tax=[Mycoplasma] falconis TaxID=92403 RepID=A0A501X9R0_9BACT|nr:toprim domain-containing protein [[Mycoplasma] falconis]TPE57216.1 recombination protein RecR [[Mycoplasma] falconis]